MGRIHWGLMDEFIGNNSSFATMVSLYIFCIYVCTYLILHTKRKLQSFGRSGVMYAHSFNSQLPLHHA